MDCTERAILTDRTPATDRRRPRFGCSIGRESNLVRRIENGSVKPYSPIPRSSLFFASSRRASLMTNSRSQELSEKAAAERRRCRDWLLPFMQDNQPKFLTKDELRGAAMRELNVSRNSFDFAWIDAIEKTGRHDWYEPLRRRLRTKI